MRSFSLGRFNSCCPWKSFSKGGKVVKRKLEELDVSLDGLPVVYIQVQYIGAGTSQCYNYKTVLNVKAGDIVVVAVKNTFMTATVIRTDVAKPSYPCKWAFMKVDLEIPKMWSQHIKED
jgi:hypothetical protein